MFLAFSLETVHHCWAEDKCWELKWCRCVFRINGRLEVPWKPCHLNKSCSERHKGLFPGPRQVWSWHSVCKRRTAEQRAELFISAPDLFVQEEGRANHRFENVMRNRCKSSSAHFLPLILLLWGPPMTRLEHLQDKYWTLVSFFLTWTTEKSCIRIFQ